LSVKLLGFYLPRLWIEISPVRVVPEGGLVKNLRPATKNDQTSRSPGLAPGLAAGPQLDALLRWVRRATSGVVALAGPDGYPVIARASAAEGPDGAVDLQSASKLAPGGGPSA